MIGKEYESFLTQIVAPAINKYGFYFSGMSIDYKSIFNIGIIDIAEYFNMDLSDECEKLSCLVILYFCNDMNMTLEQIEKSNAQNTLPPAFRSLYDLGINLISK